MRTKFVRSISGLAKGLNISIKMSYLPIQVRCSAEANQIRRKSKCVALTLSSCRARDRYQNISSANTQNGMGCIWGVLLRQWRLTVQSFQSHDQTCRTISSNCIQYLKIFYVVFFFQNKIWTRCIRRTALLCTNLHIFARRPDRLGKRAMQVRQEVRKKKNWSAFWFATMAIERH